MTHHGINLIFDLTSRRCLVVDLNRRLQATFLQKLRRLVTSRYDLRPTISCTFLHNELIVLQFLELIVLQDDISRLVGSRPW